MPQPHYNAAEHFADAAEHPALRPAFSLRNRLARGLWGVASVLLFRFSPRPLHGWRALLLRCFGAKLGRGVHIYPGAKIWAPWNLHCADYASIADGVDVYNPAPVSLGEFCVVSQDSYLCGATHDYNDAAFPLLAFEMKIGARAWICARASVGPGVQVGEGAVLGLASVATRSLEAWTVYAGSPARPVKQRKRTALPTGLAGGDERRADAEETTPGATPGTGPSA